jgi:GT2 family glycosyltransferase
MSGGKESFEGQRELTALRTELSDARARLAEERAAVVGLRAELETTRLELSRVYGSLSWRWTRLPRLGWRFARGLGPFLREMRGFPRRARFTWMTRGPGALFEDVHRELATRLRRGTLAAPPPRPPAPDAAALPFAARGFEGKRSLLQLPLASEPLATVVIPVFNQFHRTYLCLASILERTGEVPYEVVVVDDGSTDETRELERVVSGIRIVRNASNRGFIDACNRGAETARGELVVFLNNDTLVSNDWLSRLVEPFEEPDVGVVGAKLVYPDGRLQECGGIVFGDGSAWNYGRGDDPANPRYEFLAEAHYCSGACLAVRRDLFRKLAGFDARFAPMYYEDVDLAFAARAAGFRVLVQPASMVVHAEGGTAGTDTGSGPKRSQTVNQRKFAEKWKETLARQPRPGSNPDHARYRSSGPHVLVIDSYTPRPDHDAGSERMLHILRILLRLGCRASFVPENRAHDGAYTRALQAAGVEAFYHPFLPSLEQHLKFYGARYDAVIMSRVDVARQALPAVRRHCPRALRVFDTVDLHFLRETRRAELQGGRLAAAAGRVKAEELAVARACDVTLVVSPVEKELLAREAPGLTVEVVSLIQTLQPTRTGFADRRGVLFIGNFHHPPNRDAVEYYLSEVHPKVRLRLPDAGFTVIGAHAPRGLERLAGDGVRFAGQLPDIRPSFAAARLSVAPLRYGAGIKGKIHTSLGFGVPVVTTSIGAEGMNLEHGEHALIADDAEAFAGAVVTLHSDAALWARLAENGLRSVASQFSHESAERALARILSIDSGSRAHDGAEAGDCSSS